MPPGSPKISILMSVYNDERFLPLALDSLRAQTEVDFEVIVVDDCSSDGTIELLRQYQAQDERFQVFRLEKQQGLTANLNQALSHARGDLIARMDSDDISAPQRLEWQAAFLREHPQVGVAGCFFDKIDANGHTLETQTTLPLDDAGIRQYLQGGNPLCHGAIMMRKSVLTDLNGYRPCFKVAQDYDLWLRIPPEWQFANIPEVLYNHRRHGWSISYQKRLLQHQMKSLALALYRERQHAPDDLDTLDRLPNATAQQAFIERFMQQDLRDNHARYSHLFLETGRRSLRHRQRKEACQQLQMSIHLNPWQLKAYRYWLEAYLG